MIQYSPQNGENFFGLGVAYGLGMVKRKKNK